MFTDAVSNAKFIVICIEKIFKYKKMFRKLFRREKIEIKEQLFLIDLVARKKVIISLVKFTEGALPSIDNEGSSRQTQLKQKSLSYE